MEKKESRSSSDRTSGGNTFRKRDDKKTSRNTGSAFGKRKDKGQDEYSGDTDEAKETKKRTYSRKDTDKEVKNADSTRNSRSGGRSNSSENNTTPSNDRPIRNDDRPFRDRPKPYGEKREFGNRKEKTDSFGEKKFVRKEGSESRPFRDRPKPYSGREGFGDRKEKTENFSEKKWENKEGGESRPFRDRPKPYSGREGLGDRKENTENFSEKKWERKEGGESRPFRDRPKPYNNRPEFESKENIDSTNKTQQTDDENVDNDTKGFVSENRTSRENVKPYRSKPRFDDKEDTSDRPARRYNSDSNEKEGNFGENKRPYNNKSKSKDSLGGKPELPMPLNKYIAHSGECSRRDAADLVRKGKVKVNEELILDPGYKVQEGDKVTSAGKKLIPTKGNVYILLNKPKGYITTNDDPQGRRKVVDLVENCGVDRVYPVGRLDRDTSGLILITNDGTLTQKLSHPSYEIKKVYHVTFDKPLTKADFEKVIGGVELEDGITHADALAYLENENEVGLEIHSGKNRIVRRIFEALGYVVVKLDRVMYAGLTKKNLPRGKWRFLDEREVVLLKHFKS